MSEPKPAYKKEGNLITIHDKRKILAISFDEFITRYGKDRGTVIVGDHRDEMRKAFFTGAEVLIQLTSQIIREDVSPAEKMLRVCKLVTVTMHEASPDLCKEIDAKIFGKSMKLDEEGEFVDA